jgi:hypothetical protein
MIEARMVSSQLFSPRSRPSGGKIQQPAKTETSLEA